ncbi:MAG: UDP-3-O-(3-hydroxymyristoyl)glucosamine N-acyltransferase [Haliscomenobacter sp.]
MEITTGFLASLLNADLEGNPNTLISRPSRIEEGGAGSVSFLGNPKYESHVYSTTASALIVPRDFQPKQPLTMCLIRVDDVYAAVSMLLERFGESQVAATSGVSDRAAIASDARIGSDVSVGHFTVVEAGAIIGDQCRIGAQVYIGRNVHIGAGSILYPGVRVLDDCRIGTGCILHSNAVIGADGFGFAPLEDGSYKKIPQIGNVVLEDLVEVGANTTIDRASIGSTLIRQGVKLDNLIQVAHNVEIGAHTAIAALTGIAGSAKIGERCMIGGQVGIAGHLKIAAGTKVQAQTGIASHVKEPNTYLGGSPAIDFNQYIRAYTVFKQLPDLYKRFHVIEKAFKNS